MEDLIKTLQEIDRDFYKGIYSVGEFYDIKKELTKTLTDKKFI